MQAGGRRFDSDQLHHSLDLFKKHEGSRGRVRTDERYVTHKVFDGITAFRQFLKIVKRTHVMF